MARYETEVKIAAPVEMVWILTQEVSRRNEWDYRVDKAHTLNGCLMCEGTQIRTEGRFLGTFSLETEYVTYEPMRRSTVKLLRTEGVPFASGSGSWEYEADGEFGCVFRATVQMNMRRFPLSGLVDRLVLQPFLAWMTRKSLARLKQLAEAEATVPANSVLNSF